MLRDIAGIRLCGANFDEVTNILLLDPHEGNKVKPVKGTLLYGRNGAGKSTLAKAVRKAKGESQDTISQAEFLSINNLPIELTEEEKSHVFVFDEEYIDKNVKFHESGLDTIIMLGHQVEIAEQLQEAQKNLEKAKGEFDIQEKTIIENEKIECKNSPKYHIKKMRLALQGDDCWAGRDKLIKNNRQNTGVRDDTYKQFITLTTTKTRDQLIIEFNETLKVLRIAQQGDAAISTKVPIFNKKYDETNILKLLRTKIERPELSERECYLLELAQTGRSSQLNDMIDIFSNTETYICPTCLQPVSEKYKQDLVQSVQKVLSKTVEEHLAELRTVMAEEIEIDFSPFSKLEMSTNSCLEILAQINMGIRNNNLLIQSKIDNPYSICNGEIISVSNLLTQLNKALENLENERLEYNKKITDTKPIIKRLTEINNLIAYLDIRELYIQYLACKAQLKKEHEKLEERRATCTNLTKLVDELEAKQKNVRVALSIINRNLSYIFFSNDRFKIDYRNNNYVLLSNVDMNRANEVRPVFRKLGMIAEKTGCAIVLIGHLNKSSGTQSTYRGLGSIDIMAAVRSLIFIGKVRKDPTTRVLIHEKSSLAPPGETMAFKLGDEEGFRWVGAYEISADELLDGKEGKATETKLERGAKLIRELLADKKEISIRELDEKAKEQGISGRTMRDVRSRMKNELEYRVNEKQENSIRLKE